MTTTDFPNLFYVYGPHAPTAFSNGPTCIEVQGEWVSKCIDHINKTGKSRIDATPEAEEGWTKQVAHFTNISLVPGTDSWYIGANIPGKLRETLNYMGGIPTYLRECNECAEKGYAGFVIA
jgi:cyclohexanone monooxygenase